MARYIRCNRGNSLGLTDKTVWYAGWKFEDKELRETACKYGTLDVVSMVSLCLLNGVGWYGSIRVDRDWFSKKISDNDRKIIESVHYWLYGEDLRIEVLW